MSKKDVSEQGGNEHIDLNNLSVTETMGITDDDFDGVTIDEIINNETAVKMMYSDYKASRLKLKGLMYNLRDLNKDKQKLQILVGSEKKIKPVKYILSFIMSCFIGVAVNLTTDKSNYCIFFWGGWLIICLLLTYLTFWRES